MKQIKYIAILAMVATFFLGQTNIAFSQGVPNCHLDAGAARLLTTIDQYGYCWGWNGSYGPDPVSRPNPPPCPGVFMCITDTVSEATSCGACSGGDTARGGKFFHIRNLTGVIDTLHPPVTIDYVEITGTQIASTSNVAPLAEICYAKRNFGASDSPNNWWLSYKTSTGSDNAVTPAQCFTPWTTVDASGRTVFTVKLQCPQINQPFENEAAYLIKQLNHLTSVIWGMNTITVVRIHYVGGTSFTINNPTVNSTRCPDGTAADCLGQ